MALLASDGLMRAGQLKAREIVIERRRFPRRRGMTPQAVVRKISRHMIGITDLLKIGLMAREAIHRCACEPAIKMALLASDGLMRAGQLKPREIVIERCRFPRIDRMAGQAVAGKIPRHMVGVADLLKISLMT